MTPKQRNAIGKQLLNLQAERAQRRSVQRVVRSGYRVSLYDGSKLRNVINLGTPGDVADMIRNALERTPATTIRVAPNK